uniref:BTB domain-containing protein n=1 Tax=Panagrolaimus sp. PS1159 TaxID=55785 RepID=A0AC35FKA4_9BILA
MFRQINFVRTVQLAEYSEMLIKISDNLEFTLNRYLWNHEIYNVKGNFEITRITEFYGNGQPKELKYNKSSTSFVASNGFVTTILTFYITAMVEMTKEIKEMCVKHELQIPSARLKCLKICNYFTKEFILPGYDGLKLTYKFFRDSTKNIFLPLLYTFYTDEIPIIEETTPTSNGLHGLPQESSIDESRPESVILSKAATLLHKLATNHRYADVFFIVSDEQKIPSHRNILAEFSNNFAAIFEESTKIPVNIHVNDFDAETIQSALNFLYDKSDSVKGKEMKVFKFAVKFGIQILIDECRSFFEESVDSTNVCEFIQIAYSNNFDELKQKCLKILAEKKEEISKAVLDELPKNIIVDAFCFKL